MTVAKPDATRRFINCEYNYVSYWWFMTDVKIYSVEDVLKIRQQIGEEEPFAVQGIPTGLYADCNRPNLFFILDHKLLCRPFIHSPAQRFFASETTKLVEQMLFEKFGKPEHHFDIRQYPQFNNEYFTIASACLDDAIRHSDRVQAIGVFRYDGIVEVSGLRCVQYQFSFAPYNYGC